MRKRPTLQAFRKQADSSTPLTGGKVTSTLLDHTSKIQQKLAKLRAQVDQKKKQNPKAQKTTETSQTINSHNPNKHKISQNSSTENSMKLKGLDQQQSQCFQQFLQRIGMAEYEKLLADNGIDSFDILKQIKQKELEEIGIAKGHALKIMVSLQKQTLRQESQTASHKQIVNQHPKLPWDPVSSHTNKKQRQVNPPQEQPLEIIIQTDGNAGTDNLTPSKRYFCLSCYQVCPQQFCNQKCEQAYNKMFQKYEQNLCKVEQLFTKPIRQPKIEAEQQEELDEMDYVTDLAFLDIQPQSHPRTYEEEEEDKLNREEYGNVMGLIRKATKETSEKGSQEF